MAALEIVSKEIPRRTALAKLVSTRGVVDLGAVAREACFGQTVVAVIEDSSFCTHIADRTLVLLRIITVALLRRSDAGGGSSMVLLIRTTVVFIRYGVIVGGTGGAIVV